VNPTLAGGQLCPRVRSRAVTLEQGPQGLRTQVFFTWARRQDRATRECVLSSTTRTPSLGES
jgi:hypothetical protein